MRLVSRFERQGVGGGVGHHLASAIRSVLAGGAVGGRRRGCGRRRRPAGGTAGCRRGRRGGRAPGMVPPFEATQAANCASADDLDRDRHVGVARAAKLVALAEIDARPVDLEPGLVELPGTASILIQKAGTPKAWMTSLEVTMNFTVAPAGTTIRSSTASSGGPSASVRERSPGCSVGSPASLSMFEMSSIAMVGIFVGPVPLVADHLDRDVGRGRRILVRAAAGSTAPRSPPGSAPGSGSTALRPGCCACCATAPDWRRGGSGPSRTSAGRGRRR